MEFSAIYGTGTQEYYAEGDWKELRPTTQKKLLAKAIAMGGDQKDLNGNMLVGRLFLLYGGQIESIPTRHRICGNFIRHPPPTPMRKVS